MHINQHINQCTYVTTTNVLNSWSDWLNWLHWLHRLGLVAKHMSQHEQHAQHGRVRVGRRVYHKNGWTDPSVPGFAAVLCLTPSSPYGAISPYSLRDNDQIMENIWQFSKVYASVPRSVQHYSRYDKTIIWDWPSEQHVADNQLLPAYTSQGSIRQHVEDN